MRRMNLKNSSLLIGGSVSNLDKNYWTAHEIAVRQTHGKANTEDLVGQPALASAKATS